MQNPLEFIRNNTAAVDGKLSDNLELYLDVMQISIAAYDLKDIESKFSNPIYDFQDIFEGYSRIGMSRLVNVMAFLISYKRMTGVYDFWIELVELVLKDILKDHKKSGVEFLVLELSTAILTGRSFMGKSDFSKCISLLEKIDPYDKYDSTLEVKPAAELHNFCMYGICAEYLRGFLTGSDTEDFIIRHWAVQKKRFDSEGRYMDPGCPMVYDITSRYRLALMLHMGYDGAAAVEMRETLLKGAPGILLQMSSSYKFPYGGRSNQFNFNETLVSSICEYYCSEFSKAGDLETAGVFKNMATKCIKGLETWLRISPARHIKNKFPADSNYGIDCYGTYERYMGTMGTFLALAVMLYKENASVVSMSSSDSGYIYETGPYFHKLFAFCGGYSVEIDKKSDPAYDATGLGRIHYSDAPPALALSMPFARQPKYLLSKFSNARGRSIGVFWVINGNKEYLAEQECNVETVTHKENPGLLEFSLIYKIRERGYVTESYIIDKGGITIAVECDFADISYCVPVLETDGGSDSIVLFDTNCCSMTHDSWVYKIMWHEDNNAGFCDYLLYNRNGVYKELNINNNKRSIEVKLSISRS